MGGCTSENFEPVIIDINSKNDRIPECLGWFNRHGREKVATYSMVTKGSSFTFQGNQYPVKENTPFEPANGKKSFGFCLFVYCESSLANN